MRLNQDTVILIDVVEGNGTERDETTKQLFKQTPIAFVPYTEKHVKIYHDWMQSSELLDLTASERLSLSDEYKSMKNWREDPTKLTFIILDPSVGPNFMAGDVNLCLLNDEDIGDNVGEVEVMIAETKSRRKGLAQLAILLIMCYANRFLNVQKFIAKILRTNHASIDLFVNKLGYREYRRVDAFEEIHFYRDLDEELRTTLHKVWTMSRVQSFQGSSFFNLALDNADDHCSDSDNAIE